MRTPTEHIKTLQRRADFLRAREHKNSYDAAELGSLEWALVNLTPQRAWVDLTANEIKQASYGYTEHEGFMHGVIWAQDKLKEKNT
jgi:hypothetical protein